ncbi:MAG: pentapeptide repeat-containing protein [Eubacteriales bacterium]
MIKSKYADLEETLRIDCDRCSGICCVALYCMKTDGFPENKEAGLPCKHLMSDFQCDIHTVLANKNMKGCLAYDCFGAGQKVTQSCYPNEDWKTNPEKANEIFQVFMVVFQLHQMAWYLLESLSLVRDEHLKADIDELITKNKKMTACASDEILHMDIEEYKASVNQVIKQVSARSAVFSSNEVDSKDYFGINFRRANLNGRDFSMALMIAANLEGCSLQGTNFLGADIRDANIKNTDLSDCIFLTQMQINSAKGNSNTKLPINLSRPSYW